MDEVIPVLKECNIGNNTIQYLHYPADKPDLVMLHATGFLPWMWHPVARRLSERFNILVPYFCDHRSAMPEEGLSWKVLADDLYSMLDILNIRKPYLAGHSMGATVATLCSALHPVDPSAMLLIEPIYLPSAMYGTKITVEQHPLASRSINRRNYWESAEEAKSYLRSKKLFSGWDEEMMNLYIMYGMIPGEAGGLKLGCPPEKEAALFMGGNARDPWPLLPEIGCPVLVIEGGTSENRAYIDLKKAASLFPRGSYMEVENAGHLVPMERPVKIAELCLDFFR